MLRNNIRRGMFFQYTDIAQAKDGSWYAWYLDDKIDPMQAAKELNDSTSN